jgi:hypothetical protein
MCRLITLHLLQLKEIEKRQKCPGAAPGHFLCFHEFTGKGRKKHDFTSLDQG